jgi:hypothetical protein
MSTEPEYFVAHRTYWWNGDVTLGITAWSHPIEYAYQLLDIMRAGNHEIGVTADFWLVPA